ncbi:hypothetical protein [Stenoxybacter acetivorans]|uniref:hypothetical protein n=1 Tax=Stenoxybacter acetivorans TaxID=422441 RepID=UPI0005656362|nr:hypothetical protein [Stenoxybacter acetivorans]
MLEKLWSPSGLLLKDIEFKQGVNLIIGKKNNSIHGSGANGIGKSSTIRLIDFLLLSTRAEDLFCSSKTAYAFLQDEDHHVCLKLNIGGRNVIIRRTFKQRNQVFLQINEAAEAEYSITEAKYILGSWLFPQREEWQHQDSSYGNLMSFFIKDDLESKQRKDPLAYLTHGGGNNKVITLLNAYLLGLPTSQLIQLLQQYEKINELNSANENFKKQLLKDNGKSLTQIRAEAVIKERELAVFCLLRCKVLS